MRTHVYVDGFNLYYGALKGRPYRWLNLSRLSQVLLPKNEILKVKFFTALVTVRPNDPNQATRQQLYLRALRTLPNLEIIYGHFLTNKVFMPVADCPPDKQQYAKVIKTEEKGSDVNLATHLLMDGFQGRYDVAVLVTNDSDLLEPIKVVRRELGLAVGILNPYRKPSRVLLPEVSFYKPIRQGVLKASQFPSVLQDDKGMFHKPREW